MSPSGFEPGVDLDRVRAETDLRQIEFHAELPSTNDRALQVADQPGAVLPALILAEEQTAGRGRGANRWWSGPGALTFSWIIETAPLGLSTRHRPKLSLTAGLAVCEALQKLLEESQPPALRFQLKWPNDVFLQQRKLAGILVEMPPGRPERLVVGIGVNLNNSLEAAPPDVREAAVSLIDVRGEPVSRTEALVAILRRLRACVEQSVADEDRLMRRWEERSLLRGSMVQLDLGPRTVVGMCRGIDADGALVLQTEYGLERFFSGVVGSLE